MKRTTQLYGAQASHSGQHLDQGVLYELEYNMLLCLVRWLACLAHARPENRLH